MISAVTCSERRIGQRDSREIADQIETDSCSGIDVGSTVDRSVAVESAIENSRVRLPCQGWAVDRLHTKRRGSRSATSGSTR